MVHINPHTPTRDESDRFGHIDMWGSLRLLARTSPLFETDTPTENTDCPMGISRTAPPAPDSLLNDPEIEEEQSLGWAILNNGCSLAKERLFFFGLPTLARVVNAYEGRGLSTADLIEQGAIGLRNAVNNFDPAPGVRFSTIASWWIKQSVKEALVQRHRTLAAV